MIENLIFRPMRLSDRDEIQLFYDAQLWKEYGSLFPVPEIEKTKTYRAFEHFLRLFEAGEECFSTEDGDVYALAVGRKRDNPCHCEHLPDRTKALLRISGSEQPTRFRLRDGQRDLAELPPPTLSSPLVLPPYTFCDIAFQE